MRRCLGASLSLLALALSARLPSAAAGAGAGVGIPALPHNYSQRVDHFAADEARYPQRYYENLTAFTPGGPILMILGGEGAVAPQTGIFYPSVVRLAQRLGAAVVEPEHRFYGTSQPAPPFDTGRLAGLTAPQALADAAELAVAARERLGCTGRAGQPRCPVVTVGGSYPGWLSAMMRLRYPAVVDIAYAASAPMRFYSQEVAAGAYYEVVTASAARASPACPAAVRAMLAATLASGASKDAIVAGANLCTPLPDYLAAGDAGLLVDEVSMVFAYSWANLNMANYPPGPGTGLARACAQIEAGAGGGDAWATLAAFFAGFAAARRGGEPATPAAGSCYNLSSQLPAGPRATISSGDWSGVGSGENGASWDFETCTLLIEAIGMNNVTDMFLPREWTLDWLNAHCAARFGVVPRPNELADLWGFDTATLPKVASRIIFTNGLNDGWSAGGILTNLSDTLLAFNIADGAHHSDLSHDWPSSADTPDVTQTRELVAQTIERWLAQIARGE